MRATHHFGDDADLGVIQNIVEIVGHQVTEGMVGEVPQVKDILDGNGLANLFLDESFILGQDLSRAAANDTEAQNRNLDHDENPFRSNIPLYHTTKPEKKQRPALKKTEKNEKICKKERSGVPDRPPVTPQGRDTAKYRSK